jgi:hypothetical protein
MNDVTTSHTVSRIDLSEITIYCEDAVIFTAGRKDPMHLYYNFYIGLRKQLKTKNNWEFMIYKFWLECKETSLK